MTCIYNAFQNFYLATPSSQTSQTSPSSPCISGKGQVAHPLRIDIRILYTCKHRPFLFLLLLSVPLCSDNLFRNTPAGAALVSGHATFSRLSSHRSHKAYTGSTRTLQYQHPGSCTDI